MTRILLLGALCVGLAGITYADGSCGWKGAKADKEDCGSYSKKDKIVKADVSTVDTAALQEKISSGGLVLIDARTAKWDDGRRLPGAISVSAESTDEQITAALADKSASIVTYCSNEKCPASDKLAQRLMDLGYENVTKYPQGLDGWVEAGQDVVETRASPDGQS